MIKKFAIAGIALVLGCAPALAASYHVVHEPHSAKCQVTSKTPDGKHWMAVGGAHKSMSSAKAAMKAAPECK